ncbi:MAG: hypothetical protein U1F41_10350 [Burkholderiales bacterium]
MREQQGTRDAHLVKSVERPALSDALARTRAAQTSDAAGHPA